MNVAIIVAAGRGTRMKDGSGTPKQFRELDGTPLVIHTLRRFEQATLINETVLVVPRESRAEAEEFAARFSLDKLRGIVAGGDIRSDSVRCGIESLRAARIEIVVVHDGARPFVMPDEIDAVVRATDETGAAILVTPATDTIKEVEDGNVVRTLARRDLRHALTPQSFRYDLLRAAYVAAERDGITDATDDSALVERLGIRVRVVEGDTRNIKITRPEDWAMAEKLVVSGQWSVVS